MATQRFLCSPLPTWGNDFQFDLRIFFKWVGKKYQLPLDPKTMKNEGFRPSIYGSYPPKMKVLGSPGSDIYPHLVTVPLQKNPFFFFQWIPGNRYRKKARLWRRRPRNPKRKNERKVGTPKRKPWEPKPLGLLTGFLQLGWWVGWGFGFVGWGRFYLETFWLVRFETVFFVKKELLLCFVFPCFFGYFFGVKPSNNNRGYWGVEVSSPWSCVECFGGCYVSNKDVFSSACSYRIMTILNHQGTPDFYFV